MCYRPPHTLDRFLWYMCTARSSLGMFATTHWRWQLREAQWINLYLNHTSLCIYLLRTCWQGEKTCLRATVEPLPLFMYFQLTLAQPVTRHYSWLAGLLFKDVCILGLLDLLYLNWLENPKKLDLGKIPWADRVNFLVKFDKKMKFGTIFSLKKLNSESAMLFSANVGLGKFLVSLIWSLHHENM